MNAEHVETVADVLEAHEELTRIVAAMGSAWERPTQMAELVDRANQYLTVLLHNAEYLARCPDYHPVAVETCPVCSTGEPES